MKVLSDFDGVWTDPCAEGAAVRQELVEQAGRAAGIELEEAQRDFEEFERAVLAKPRDYGWISAGRLTAFADEDPFCLPSGLAGWVESAPGQRERAYRQAILGAGHASLSSFADHCFHAATARLRAEHPPAMLPESRAHFDQLIEAGAEVVVVSNSSEEKVVGWFRSIGVDAGVEQGRALRVVGSARKFELGASGEALSVAGREVQVDRPLYRAVLETEGPDVVLGDVFSLDLALPHFLRLKKAPGAPRHTVLRRNAYSPDWVTEKFADGAIDHVVDSVGELAVLIQKLD